MQRTEIVLTRGEANELLAVLSELPIKYLSVVQMIQKLLSAKFDAPKELEGLEESR